MANAQLASFKIPVVDNEPMVSFSFPLLDDTYPDRPPANAPFTSSSSSTAGLFGRV